MDRASFWGKVILAGGRARGGLQEMPTDIWSFSP
jgi:hypothetical protein